MTCWQAPAPKWVSTAVSRLQGPLAKWRGNFRELASGCAVYDLGWRAKVVINGEDRVRWLNGMVTNNIKDLPLNQGNYSFILNPQGRILGDLYTYNRGDYLLIDTERSQLENLLKLFEHFIIMDDVQVTDKSAALTAIGIQGPNAGTDFGKSSHSRSGS
jgi:folate-binding Fe-S cluster repair protein YgfZ